MKNKIIFLAGTLTFLSISSLKAETQSATLKVAPQSVAAPAAPTQQKWKTTANSYYYDFQGTKAAAGDIYNFGKASLFLELVSLQYKIDSNWTVLALGQFLQNYVETNVPIPGFGTLQFQDKTIGWGDTLVDAVRPIYLSSSFLLFGDLGLSIPTGSIDKINASAPNSHYAYNMQMGSGTYDIEAGAVGVYLHPLFQAGSHLSTFQRMGENKNSYRLGNLYKAEGWLDFPIGLGFTPRIVGYYKVKTAINGNDPKIARNIYTEYYHHDQRNWDVSAALKFERKLMGALNVNAEVGRAIYQGSKNSAEVVVSTNYYGSAGVSGAF